MGVILIGNLEDYRKEKRAVCHAITFCSAECIGSIRRLSFLFDRLQWTRARSGGQVKPTVEMKEQLENVKQERERLQMENALLRAAIETRKPESEADGEARLLNVEEKFEVANAEIEKEYNAVENRKKSLQQKIDKLRSNIEEASSCEQDAHHDVHELKRALPSNQQLSPAKVLSILDSAIDNKKAQVDKLKMRASNLKSKVKKQETHLSQKDELSDAPSAIDYDQLKIENQQALEKIEERNSELLKLKLATGKLVQELTYKKRKLSGMAKQGEQLQADKQQREQQLARYDDEIQRMRERREELKQELELARRENEDVDKPRVMDYIKVKQERQQAEQKLDELQRKFGVTNQPAVATDRSLRWL